MAKKTRSASARGKLSRMKGKVFEREVARDLRAIYGEQVKRGWQAREGTDAPDVENVPYWVECKHHQRVNVRAAVAQARADVKKSKRELPILVVVKDNGESPLAVLDWGVFVALLEELEVQRNESTLLKSGALPQGLEERERAAQARERVLHPLMVVPAEGGAPVQLREVEVFVPAQPPSEG